ncbi:MULTISPECIES: hypothetical protein [unclassified Streptomyces]|uniref:hypothetical protein n=1 Tax=unclassified Streptomyces TaxID=2593676 RepID=UPI000804E7EB|nr:MULTISPECIES: hypothetical protein [unclassified Streptomyces]SBV01791.1 hypothetical protein YUMDRAFT_06551 [Streptomyces sp. OspMP-M45]
MAVNGTEYRMWVRLAQRQDLPEAGLAAVVDGLLPGDEGFLPGWQEDVFQEALPGLFGRVGDQELRDRLIVASPRRITELIRQGLLGPPDVPAVLRCRPVDGELLAALAQHEAHQDLVLDLIETLHHQDLIEVVLAAERLRPGSDLSRLPVAPEWLVDAVLRRGLGLMAAKLDAFASVNSGARTRGRYWQPSGWPSWNTVGMVLERCPDRWLELTQDETLGRVAQHMLLDCVKTEKLPDEVLAACVPALVLPEWAQLPMPGKSQRLRLQNIARRVNLHPRLRELATATEPLREAAAHCVKAGGLLHTRKLRDLQPYEVVSLAHDLAQTSNDAKTLAKVCEAVAQLPRPTAVERPSPYDGPGAPTPKGLLSDDNRVSALAALARNPHLDRHLVSDLLAHLHPAEIQWLRTYDDAVPAWLKDTAAQHKASPTQQQEVPRVLTDEELDSHEDPEAVMQSWLDAVKDHRGSFFDQVEYAVIRSRHRTEALVRQVRAHIVLSYHEQPVAADALVRLCGENPARWHAVAEALASRSPDRFDETFGQFIDRMTAQPA